MDIYKARLLANINRLMIKHCAMYYKDSGFEITTQNVTFERLRLNRAEIERAIISADPGFKFIV